MEAMEMDKGSHVAIVALQAFQLLLLLTHDWIPLGRFNDIPAVRRENTTAQLLTMTVVNCVPVALRLWGSLRHFGRPYPTWVRVWLWLTYGLLFLGELRAWWLPYLFGTDAARVARYQAMLGRTHAFLPPRNGIVPNTLHVSLHLSTLATLLALFKLKHSTSPA
jgi:hypothetical protein